MEKHSISVDDEKVSAFHMPEGSEKWIFFCHGFADTKERSMKPLAEEFNDRGFNTVVFDFRGNGESSRKFRDATLSTRIEDLEAVINHFDPEKCFVYGTSFGAKVAFHTAAKNDLVDSLVVKAPVTYNKIMGKFREVMKEKGEAEFYGKKFGKKFFDDLDSYSFENVEDKLDVPTAVFHGGSDTTVHPEKTLEAAKKLNVELQIRKIRGEKHSFSDKAEEKLVKEAIRWLEQF